MDEVFGEENFIAAVIWQKVFSPKTQLVIFLRTTITLLSMLSPQRYGLQDCSHELRRWSRATVILTMIHEVLGLQGTCVHGISTEKEHTLLRVHLAG